MAKRITKRKFSSLTLNDSLKLFDRDDFIAWNLTAPLLPPTDILMAIFKRLEGFDLKKSEAAKELLIDALFGEIILRHDRLKIWKTEPLATDTLNGFADYLVAPRRAVVGAPLLCTVEAKRDDFEQGEAQCLGEMYACQWINAQENFGPDIYGIVSNGTTWQFYKTDASGDLYRSGVISIDNLTMLDNLPQLLGAIDAVFAACAAVVGGK